MNVKTAETFAMEHVRTLLDHTIAFAQLAMCPIQKETCALVSSNFQVFKSSIIYTFPDIDECHLGIHDCSRDALCSNTIGGFNCTCKGNFFGNGRSCLSKEL